MESVESLICAFTIFAEINTSGNFIMIIGGAVCHWSMDMIIGDGLLGLAGCVVVEGGLEFGEEFWSSSMELSLDECVEDRVLDLVSMVYRSSSKVNSSPFDDVGQEGKAERGFLALLFLRFADLDRGEADLLFVADIGGVGLSELVLVA